MSKFPFTDKNEQIFYHNPDEVKCSDSVFIVVKHEDNILCLRDELAQMYTLPSQNDVTIDAEPTDEFEIIAYVIRGDEPVKELQLYKLYEVESVDLKGMPLEWVKLSSILFDEVSFDATMKSGMKNLLVRGK